MSTWTRFLWQWRNAVSNRLPLNPALRELPVYQPGRPIEEVARELGMDARAVIKLASNENPLGPSPAAVAAMEKALQTLHLYPDGNAYYLKQALAAKLGVEPQHLILGNGSNEIIEFVGHALIAPGTDVIVSQYCFAVYPIVARLFGANLISVPAVNYGHDLAAMLAAITPQTRVMFVANPNNPTGTLARREDIVMLLNEIPQHVLLVMDEAYIEFLQDAVDLLPFVQREIKPNLLLMRTFSKIYGLAGLRLGYGIGHPDLIAALEKVRQPFNINSLVQAGAIAALGDTEHTMRTRANNFGGMRFLEQGLRQLGLRFVPSAGNFILVEVGDGGRVFERLQEQGLITRPMAGYQLPEFIRISVGTPAENQRCLAALERVLERTPNA
jgi:histidinol-phosphate aminotransferase